MRIHRLPLIIMIRAKDINMIVCVPQSPLCLTSLLAERSKGMSVQFLFITAVLEKNKNNCIFILIQ